MSFPKTGLVANVTEHENTRGTKFLWNGKAWPITGGAASDEIPGQNLGKLDLSNLVTAFPSDVQERDHFSPTADITISGTDYKANAIYQFTADLTAAQAQADVTFEAGTEVILLPGGGSTDLDVTASPTQNVVTNTGGTDATLNLADAINSGLAPPVGGTVGEVLTISAAGVATYEPAPAGGGVPDYAGFAVGTVHRFDGTAWNAASATGGKSFRITFSNASTVLARVYSSPDATTGVISNGQDVPSFFGSAPLDSVWLITATVPLGGNPLEGVWAVRIS